MSIVAAVVAIAGGVYAGSEQHAARKEQKQANEKAQRIEAVKSQRERARAIQANRVNAAQVFAQAGNATLGTSSGVQGTVGAGATQLAGEIATAGQIDILQGQRLGHQSRADDRLTRAGYGQQVSNFARSYGG